MTIRACAAAWILALAGAGGDADAARLAQVKRRLAMMAEDSSMDCAALAPINP